MGTLFEPENSKVSAILTPGGDNPRNSEGDFIRLRDGRILFAFSYYHGEDGHDHARCEIRCIESRDDGRSFDTSGEPRLLINAADFGEKNVMSVTLLRMRNGDVGLICILKHRDGTDECLLFRSSDEGASFRQPVSILPGAWRGYYVLNNSRVERLSDGRLLAPVARHEVGEGGKYEPRSSVWFFFSDDDGESWARGPAVLSLPSMAYTRTGLQEPGVIELKNGDLYAYMRTDLGCQYEALSPDGGAHWFGPQPSRFTSPPSPLEIARNPYNGKYYAMWNPVPNYAGRQFTRASAGRTPLALAVSEDGYNYDLSRMQTVEDDPERGYSYPALFFTDERTLLAAYCSGGPAEGSNLYRLTIRRIVLN